MRFACRVRPLQGGLWEAVVSTALVGRVTARGASRAEALEKLRGEVRFRLELCPCSSVADDYVQLDVDPG